MGTHPIFESDFDCLTVMDENLILRKSKSSLGSYRDPLPLGWPLLVNRDKSRQTKSRPVSGRRLRHSTTPPKSTTFIASNLIQPTRPSKSQEEVLHSQPGFRLVKS